MATFWVPSPNYSKGRSGKKTDRMVIHWIVGTLTAADTVFKTPGKTSAHYAIENNIIHQYVNEGDTAYHAGNWDFNLRSIGIEHSADPKRPASEQTYQTSGKLIGEICKRNNIPIDRSHIVQHKQIVATQCPGTINLDKLISIAKGVSNVDLELERLVALFTVLLGKKPGKYDIEAWRKSKLSAGAYAIKHYLINWVKKSQYDKDIASIRTQLTKLEEAAKTAQTVAIGLQGRVKDLEASVVTKDKEITELKQQLAMPVSGVEKPTIPRVTKNDGFFSTLLKRLQQKLFK